jgi:chromosome segregation ATPase
MVRIAVMVLLLVPGLSLAAEARRSAGGEEVARLQTMMQQLNSEKTALASENVKLKKELEVKSADFETLKSENASSRQKLGANAQDLVNARAKGDQLQSAFDTLKGRFEELVGQYRKTVGVMRELEAERNKFRDLASDYDVRVATCERNNDAMYKATGELIELYEKKGFMSVLSQREPVTRLKQAQIDNLMDQYRGLAEDMRLKYGTEAGAAAASSVDAQPAAGDTPEQASPDSDGA